MSDKFKDSRGRWRTQSLFLEQSYASTSTDAPMYTLSAEDKDGLPSFRRLYLELADPTDYKPATELLGGWEHWKALVKSEWFTAYLKELHEELNIKLRSEGIATLRKNMKVSDKPVPAARYFADGTFKDKRTAGRPTKAEKTAAAHEMAAIEKRLEDDAKRLGLVN